MAIEVMVLITEIHRGQMLFVMVNILTSQLVITIVIVNTEEKVCVCKVSNDLLQIVVVREY